MGIERLISFDQILEGDTCFCHNENSPLVFRGVVTSVEWNSYHYTDYKGHFDWNCICSGEEGLAYSIIYSKMSINCEGTRILVGSKMEDLFKEFQQKEIIPESIH